MSHDQRPGKLRVVRDERRPSLRIAVENTAEIAPPPPPATAPEPARLPLAPAILFLLACIGGSVAVVLLAPFRLG